ncbi:MAG TPA: hypothetical protein VHX87_06410 [Galbitalea sp.]|nr:hypothetical protein [Galbitalea sp.]
MSRGRLARLGLVAAAALGVAGVTAAVFLIRAGGSGPSNWPVNFELGSSDNGVLFQFAGDVFHGRPLDWSFSPQVFVFPEIPISLLAYLLAGGGVQLYYLVVAMINVVILFVAFYGVIRAIYSEDAFVSCLVRALLASSALVLLPLVGTVSLFDFQLAPTYYYGMYLALAAWPLLYVSRRRVALVLVGLGLALIVASNPLTLIFALPALIVLGLVRRIAMGLRAVLWPLIVTVGVFAVAAGIRLALFSGLQGTSPLTYIDASQLPQRVTTLAVNFGIAAHSDITLLLLLIGFGAAVWLFVFAARRLIRVLRHREVLEKRDWILLYYALVPVTGLLAAVALLILNYLYLWPILVAPLAFAPLMLPAPQLRRVGFATSGVLVVALIVTFIVVAPASPARYLAYRDQETRCLDSELPTGMDVGYAGYFDARRIELTSTRSLLLIQVDYHGRSPYLWLTNRDYPTEHLGRFFFVNSASGQLTITSHEITTLVGAPDRRVVCPDGSELLIYTKNAKLAKIDARYHQTR